MNNSNFGSEFAPDFWQDVTKTYRALPLKMKVVWLLAPPMCALVMMAYLIGVFDKAEYRQIDAAS